MALFRKFFYRKPPDGLLEISESVYVFDYCFTTDVLEEDEYKVYIGGIIGQLQDHFPDSSFMVFNFREGEKQSQIASILCDYDMTVMEYPRQYEGCPLLTMETIHHFLRSGESWLQLGQQNVVLMHCERGGWPVLAFMLAALLIYRKQYTGEQKTLDMIYKQAPRELLQLMSPLNPLPSQLRYLQYISRRNVGSEWPPLDRALTLDCVIIRLIPNMDGEGGCRPIFRIYGQDPFMAADRTPKVLFSTPKRSKLVRHYKQADCELVKIDIHCHVQGDVVLECISLDSDLEREQMMFRVMFNTAFIRSNILMLNRDEIDILWNGKDNFPKDFRVEVLFSDMDASSSVISIDLPRIEEKEGLPVEAFAKVQEIFSNVDWLDSKTEVANVLQQITASNMLLEKLDTGVSAATSSLLKGSMSGRFIFEPKTLPENDIKSMTSTVQGKLSLSPFESSVDTSNENKIEALESKALSENNSKIPASIGRGKQLISLSEPSTNSDSAKKKFESLESKALLENDTKGLTLTAQGIQSIPLIEPSVDANSTKKKIEALESKALLENDTKCVTSTDEGKQSILLIESPTDANSMKKKFEPLESKALSENDIKNLTSAAQCKESIPSYEPSVDANSIEKKIEPQDFQIALQLPTQSKIISQRVHQASRSTPLLYCSSLQGSPVPISRYHSAPSALGITALLKDHTAIDVKEEVTHAVTVSPPSSTLSPVLGSPKYIEHSTTCVPPVSSSTLLPSLSTKSSMGAPAAIENTFGPLPLATASRPLPPPQPQPTSELMQPVVTQHPETTIHDKGPKSLVPPPPPLSEAIKSSLLTPPHPTPVPLPPYSSVKSSFSPPSLHTSFPGTSPRSTVKNLFKAPPPLPSPPSPSIQTSFLVSPPPHSGIPSSAAYPIPSLLSMNNSVISNPPPPPPLPSSTVQTSFLVPPPPLSGIPSAAHPILSPLSTNSYAIISVPPPPLPPSSSTVQNSFSVPPPPGSGIPSSVVHRTPSPPTMNSTTTISSPPPPPPPPSSTVQTSFSVPPSSLSETPSSAAHSVPSTVSMNNSVAISGPPPPPPPPSSTSFLVPPPPLSVIPSAAHPVPSPISMKNSAVIFGTPPPPPPPPPRHSGMTSGPILTSSMPPPPPPPISASKTSSKNSATVPPVPPPPFPSSNGLSKAETASLQSPPGVGNASVPPVPGPPSGVPFGVKGRGLLRTNQKNQNQTKRSNLKPYHWLKLTRVMHGSLWAETQKPDEASKAPEFDMSELESLFSAVAPNSDHGSKGGKSNRRASGPKAEKVQLIELRRAYNCEIMLTKVKIPLPDLMSSVLALDDSALDADQVENLIKFCPTKEEMELLKGYNGDKDNLGRCEQFFLELMKVPRVESKLRVFSFKIQFRPQVSELRRDLNIVNSASEEIRNSVKLKRIMQTILSLGNALNHGTARGSAIGFRLDSLLKLTDTRARNNKMTLMHYLCKVLAEKLPELLDFSKDLVSLEASTKIQLKYLAEEMQAISKGLEKVVQELTASENDGPVSECFCKILKEFLSDAEAEVRSLAQLYSNVGRNADALALYFGEDPARCPFEQVVSTLLNFVRMFVRAHEENCKQLEFEKKKALKEAENERLKLASSKKESEHMIRTPIKSGNMK